MRLRRLPESFKPTICVHCGKSKRLDAHHTDYSKPDYVVWVCRSCHMKAHRDKNLNESLCQHLSYVPTLGEYEASSDFHLYRRLAKKAGAK
jgi:predicted metal-binding protein